MIRLFGRKNNSERRFPEDIYGKMLVIPIKNIVGGRYRVKKDMSADKLKVLADSFLKYGILQPLLVRPASDVRVFPRNTSPLEYKYELISGERRLIAARIAGFGDVPCIILHADGRRAAQISAAEGIHREDGDIFLFADTVSMLISKFGMTPEQAAASLFATKEEISDALRILSFSEKEREVITKNHFPEGFVTQVMRLDEENKRLAALRSAAEGELSLADFTALVDKLASAHDNPSLQKAKKAIRDMRFVTNTLQRAADTIERAGLNVRMEKSETQNGVEVRIVVETEKVECFT